jgi:hypothetical protein
MDISKERQRENERRRYRYAIDDAERE